MLGAFPTRPGTSPLVLAPGMVSLDWLTLNMLAPEVHFEHRLPWQAIDPAYWNDESDTSSDRWRRYVIEPTTKRADPLARVTYINNDRGEKCATVCWQPYNGALHNPRWIQVQFANHTLYSNEWVALFGMFRHLGSEFTGISRVDIAADGLAGDGGDFPQVIAAKMSGAARYYGKGDWLVRSTRDKVLGGEFGSKASNKFIRAYGKKREMKAKGCKPHIVAGWLRAFGFDAWADPKADVNRLEISIKGKEVRRYFPGERSAAWVEGLANIGQRVDVFDNTARSLFDFRTAGAERARDAEPIAVWDWSRVDASPALIDRAPRALQIGDHTIKTGIHAMFRVAHYTASAEGFEACKQFAAACGPAWVHWFEQRRAHWVREFAKVEQAVRYGATAHTHSAAIIDALRGGTDEPGEL